MSQSRKAPFDRLLRLVRSLSESTDGLTLDDMAEVLGQGRRSAERTRNVIALHFDLDEITDGTRKRFRIVDGLRRHFTRPSAQEIAALRAEVESLRPGGGMRFQELQSLLSKVQSSFDDREKRRLEPDLEELLKCQRSFSGPGPIAQIDRATSRAVMDSIMSGLCLEFEYQAADAKKPEWRKVASAGLLNGPISYLVGFIPGAERGPAIYRLDRMRDARLSDDIAEVPDSFVLDDWIAEGFGIWREEAREVVLRILPRAADRARSWRFHPKQTIEEQQDGGLIISFRAGGLREIAEHLFQWAGELVIEKPNDLKNVMRDRLSLAQAMWETAMRGKPADPVIDHDQLKEKQRRLRDGFSTELTLRVHRGLSWYGRASSENDDADVRFILLWIAFNAAYASDLDVDVGNDRDKFRLFFRTLIELDGSDRIYRLVWSRFSSEIRLLLDNRFVFAPFWANQNGVPGNEDWEARLARAKHAVGKAIAAQDTATILSILFDRLYVLRNQLIHGGATWCSKVNRDQVRDGSAILANLVPIFIDIMMDNPQHPWGMPFYPVIE